MKKKFCGIKDGKDESYERWATTHIQPSGLTRSYHNVLLFAKLKRKHAKKKQLFLQRWDQLHPFRSRPTASGFPWVLNWWCREGALLLTDNFLKLCCSELLAKTVLCQAIQGLPFESFGIASVSQFGAMLLSFWVTL